LADFGEPFTYERYATRQTKRQIVGFSLSKPSFRIDSKASGI
jgi:hypothetical protein